MQALECSANAFVAPPDPGQAGSLDELGDRLRVLKGWAGDPSYATITRRINAAWMREGRTSGELVGKTTVVDCFRTGRRRVNPDLVVAVVQVLHPDVGYVSQWRQALHVIGGRTRAAAQVRVEDGLPPGVSTFTGRIHELNLLRAALNPAAAGEREGAVCVISGMAGVGKTQLAIRAAHLTHRDRTAAGTRVDQVLFVNLRGFDPAQPPADPAAVLDGFLRVLGVSGHQVPYELDGRIEVFRTRLRGTRTLLVLDNAAGPGQVMPLLPGVPGCPVLITSRRALPALDAGLEPAVDLRLDAFTAGEAMRYLEGAVPSVQVGGDPDAAARIAYRCGYLPLALGLVAAHIDGAPGWTLTDHADRLEERHRHRRLDAGVEAALDLSYQHLPADRQHLFRLAALHPAEEFDVLAAAALTGADVPSTQSHLDQLCRDHLLHQHHPGRYLFHDLVRDYARASSADEDPPPACRAALTRLFDYYLAAAATAMDSLYPAETHRRPTSLRPGTPTPDLADPDAAMTWLNIERPTLTVVAARTATDGWPAHAIRLSAIVFRYLDGGYHGDALTIHGHALQSARHTGDRPAQAHALNNLGAALAGLGRYEPAREHLQQAFTLFQLLDDQIGQTRPLSVLGCIELQLGHYGSATDHFEQALTRCREARDTFGEARALGNLGLAEARLGRHGSAADHLEQALALFRNADDVGGEAAVLDTLGILRTRCGQPGQATRHHQQALARFRATGQRAGEAAALNGLGEAAHAGGDPARTLTHHTQALAAAAAIRDLDEQARAHAGLGHAHQMLGQPAMARRSYQSALTLYLDLGAATADEMRTCLTTLDRGAAIRMLSGEE